MPSKEIAFRPAGPNDIRFIFDSWLKSWRTCRGAGTIRNDLYFTTQRATIEGLIARGATLEVACLAADPDKILGWACVERTPDQMAVVHYIYVKDAYFTYELGSAFVEHLCSGSDGGFYTHDYRQVTDACPRARGWVHAPEIARRR